MEVLGEEEMQEENGIKPGNIASLLGDISGIQIQPTSPTTGNADLRIQGLQGQYSQILRDGLPLYGGFAGSFGILAVPPLDLRQIELLNDALRRRRHCGASQPGEQNAHARHAAV